MKIATVREVIEMLTKAGDLGVTSLRIDGLEVTFRDGVAIPKVSAPKRVRPQVEATLDSNIDPEFRLKGIGGSDAPIVMEATPQEWATRQKLWEIKTRRRQSDPPNYPMRRGLRLEPHARARYEDMTGIQMPAMRAIHPTCDFIRANADGINMQEGRALEIKCPGKEDHAKAMRGEIPEKYIYQLVHILYVFDLDRMDYFSFDGKDGVVVPFDRDRRLEKKLIPEETRFWEHVVKDIPPDPPKPPTDLVRGKPSPFKVRRG